MPKYDIAELIKKGESDTVEFKSFVPPVQALSKLISSFANTKGGLIVLGIRDDQVVGIPSGEERVSEICNAALRTINPKPQCNTVFEKYQNKLVAILEIGSSKDIVLSGNNIGYYREKNVVKPLTSKKIIENVQSLPQESALVLLAEKIEEQSKTIIKLTDEIKEANKPWRKIASTVIGFLLGILASYLANKI